MKKLAVVAFGGNALLRSGQKGTISEQEANVFETCLHLKNLVKNKYDIVIGHGNGPQVGNVLLQHEAGEEKFNIPKLPLDVCVAETQGSIGYMIEQQLKNVLMMEGLERDVITLVTRIFVDKKDPAFKNPTKPIGPYYSEEKANKLTSETGDKFAIDPRGRGWRKVVASPNPVSISNQKTIEALAREGKIIVTVGGGGIPVFYIEEKKIEGIEAVIDKDLASSMLATQIKADEFFILTDVPKVCINFNTPEQKELDLITVEEAEKYLSEGHFAEGSMAPKVRAAIQFVKSGGGKCIITEAAELSNPNAGTKIVLTK